MSAQRVSHILSIILSVLAILSAISIFIGQICLNNVNSGFFTYLLNIFSAPILMIYPVFVGLFGGLWVTYLIVSVIFVVGVLSLALVIKQIQSGENKTFEITVFVLSCIGLFMAAIIIFSLLTNGIKILSDSSIWSVFWLILFLIGLIWSFVLKLVLLIKNHKQSKPLN